MRAAPTYFINFLYAFRLPPHRCACLLPSPCNLNLCTKLPQLPFEGACTQQSISCPFAAEGLQPPRGCSPQAASPATRKAKSQGRKAKEKKKKKKSTHTRHAERQIAKGSSNWQRGCDFLCPALAGYRRWLRERRELLPGAPPGSRVEIRRVGAEGLLQPSAQRPSSQAKCPLSLQILLLLLVQDRPSTLFQHSFFVALMQGGGFLWFCYFLFFFLNAGEYTNA